MAALHEWIRRFWGTLRGTPNDRELEDELKLHLEFAGEAMRGRGNSPEAARRAARLEAGGIAQAMDALRDQRGLPWLEDLARDVRHGLRSLRRSPGFTVVALLTLALAIGANTAIFSIVNGVLMRPLDYPKPEQLMYLDTQFPALGFMHFPVSPPEYMEFREINRSFSDVGAYRTGEVNLTEGDRPLRVRSALVDSHLLNVLGVQAEQGRLFAAGETEVTGPPPAPGQRPPPAAAIVILSHELWRSAFGARPIIGQTVEINGRRHEVMGIMPRGFDVADNRTEVWLPLGVNPANRQNRALHILNLIGRLKDGVTRQAAQTELNALIQNWGERAGIGPKQHAPAAADAHILKMKPLQEEIVGSASQSIWALQVAVGFVLLIACANLANLLLARAETRHRQLAVLTALGASRGRLLRQFMIEAVLLSIAGGALGLLLAQAGVQALMLAFPNSLPRTHEVAVDSSVLLFTFCVSTATGLLFGLAPITHTSMKGLVTGIREAGMKGATRTLRHHVRSGLVIAEVAIAVVLVIGAGLLARTVHNLVRVDAGFDRSRLVTFQITLPPNAYPKPAARAAMFENLADKLRALPGVQAAAAMSGLPPHRPLDAMDMEITNVTAEPGLDEKYRNVHYSQAVTSDYFETMGIPIVQGRGFERRDASSSALVAVVNETFANTFWKGQNPIGQQLRPCCRNEVPWFTVIGVARDVKQRGLDQKTGTEFYVFVEQQHRSVVPVSITTADIRGLMNFVVRTSIAPAALSQTISRVVREIDPAVPVVRLREMDEAFAESIRRPRLLAQLVGGFAGLALLLAAIGTYGVLSFMVAERRREVGIRLALGAERSSVLAQVMKQGLSLTAIGVIAGLAGAFGLNRLIASLLFGVQPTDATTLAAVIATITLVAAFACWLPAWRASRLDPIVVLRDE